MKEGIIIQARLGSSRLPSKVLLPLSKDKIPVCVYLYNRLREYLDQPIVYAIPDQPSDDYLADILCKNDIPVFRGNELDLITRYLDCAKYYNFSTIVRVTSDCPLVDPTIIKTMIEQFNANQIDYFANTAPPSLSRFSDGSDVEIFTLDALLKANKQEISKKNREHVTFQFWQNTRTYKSRVFYNKGNDSDLRFTLDNPEDYLVIKSIINFFEERNLFPSYDDIVTYLRNNYDVRRINSKYNSGDNW